MNCYCCGKPLSTDDNYQGWHLSCLKKFFGTEHIFPIDVNNDAFAAVLNSLGNGDTIPGVQKKLSLHLSLENKHSKLTLSNYPVGYILKPQVDSFECLPEAEQLVMLMAERTGIRTVPHGLLLGKDGFSYITKRVDRIYENGMIKKLAMEDFCPLDQRLTEDKYKGSYERCAKVISRYSVQSGLDMAEFYMRLVFSYLVGNSDMHLKNFSLIETNAGSNKYILSPAYDMLPVNVIMPEDKEQFALTLHGKKTNISREDFLIFASDCMIPQKAAEKMIRKVLSLQKVYEKMCEDSYLNDRLKKNLIRLIGERCKILEG